MSEYTMAEDRPGLDGLDAALSLFAMGRMIEERRRDSETCSTRRPLPPSTGVPSDVAPPPQPPVTVPELARPRKSKLPPPGCGPRSARGKLPPKKRLKMATDYSLSYPTLDPDSRPPPDCPAGSFGGKPPRARSPVESMPRQPKHVSYEEMKRLMWVYGPTKCLRNRTPPGENTKAPSVRRKFYRWFPDFKERFVKGANGMYAPRIGHEEELRWREESRRRDQTLLAAKRNAGRWREDPADRDAADAAVAACYETTGGTPAPDGA